MIAVKHSSRKHALLSASGASRWLNCTPSPRLEQQFIEGTTSSYAAEGTLAHEFGDIGLQKASGQLSAFKYKKAIVALRKDPHHTEEMESEVQKYIDYVMEQFGQAKRITPGAVLSIEEKLDLTHYIEDGFGTNDAIVVADKTMEVDDLKYGKGIRVDAKDNPQLMLYGLGALRAHELLYDIETVKLTIIQPRLNSISSWEISAEDLRTWGEKEVKPKAKKAFEGSGIQKAGAWCRWCKANATCATLAAKNVKLAQHDFKSPHLLNDKQLLEVYKQLSLLEMWAKAVKEHFLNEALAGKSWPGYKLVEGRSNRKWLDEKAVIGLLSLEGFTALHYMNSKLAGITAIEKLVGKKEFTPLFQDLVVKPPGRPTLVVETDKRPALGIEQAKIDFK